MRRRKYDGRNRSSHIQDRELADGSGLLFGVLFGGTKRNVHSVGCSNSRIECPLANQGNVDSLGISASRTRKVGKRCQVPLWLTRWFSVVIFVVPSGRNCDGQGQAG